MSHSQDIAGVRREERAWQDLEGGGLQERAYERPGTRVVLEGQFERIVEALDLKPGQRLLDIGCGVGHLLRWIVARHPVECYGVDLSPESARNASGRGDGVKAAAGDSAALPYKSGSFDRVVCNGAAHHFLDSRSAFGEMHRVLRPGGVLVLHEPTSSVFTNLLRGLVFWSRRCESPADLAHKEHFTEGLVRDSLAAAGFTGVSVTFHDFLAYPLSGNYLGSPLSRSARAMAFLMKAEDGLGRRRFLRALFKPMTWRMLATAVKPER